VSPPRPSVHASGPEELLMQLFTLYKGLNSAGVSTKKLRNSESRGTKGRAPYCLTKKGKKNTN